MPRVRLIPPALVAALLVLLGLLYARHSPPQPSSVAAAVDAPVPNWVYLSDLPWARAASEFMMMGYESLPAVDSAFYAGGPLVLHGETFAKGFGAYAPSEIVYQLRGGYDRVEALVGVEDDGLAGTAAARVLVFLDGVQAYESPAMEWFDEPVHISLPTGQVDELRLVTVRTLDSARGARVNWVNVRAAGDLAVADPEDEAFLARLRERRAELAAQRASETQETRAAAQREIADLRADLGGALPSAGDLPRVARNARTGVLTIASNLVAVRYGLGGSGHGRFSVIDLNHERYAARDLVSTIQFGDDSEVDLHAHTFPESSGGYHVERLDDPVLGPGTRVNFGFLAGREWRSENPIAGLADEDILRVTAEVSLFRNSSVLLYRLSAGVPDGLAELVAFHYFDQRSGGLQVGEDVSYLTDFVRLRHVRAPDDGLRRSDYAAWGKPVYIWSGKDRSSLLLALLEETPLPPRFALRLDPGRVSAQAGWRAPAAVAGTPDEARSALLYLSVGAGPTMQADFAGYRRLMEALYPPPPLPAWFRNQWLSWYVYYMQMSEQELVRQIDRIAEDFGDLGPWHIIVDAGWYVAEGRDGAEWRRQDFDKFPRGLRWLVDYAHSRGVKVVLYFSAPYLNSREWIDDWLGLRGITDQHPEWLIRLDDDPEGQNYVYDFQNPELRQYLRQVMADYFLRYDVDGIKLDGLGSAGDAVLYSHEGMEAGFSMKAIGQTLDIYRFVYEQATRWKPDAYVESGWMTPTLANPYAHTFRYGDEETLFTRPYPLPGFIEHVDYAAYQQGLLGQRSNMGAIYGSPPDLPANLWWIEAALALGAQVSISIDLDQLTPDALSRYRARLAAYQPFQGATIVDDQVEQRIFSTRRGDTLYVGLLNRSGAPRRVSVQAATLGLPRGTAFTAYDIDGMRFFYTRGSFTVRMEAESFRLFVLRTEPGLLWTNSAVAVTAGGTALEAAVTAPTNIDGFAHFATPRPKAVQWDGEDLAPSEHPFQDLAGYTYDEASSVLQVWFPAGSGAHRLRLEW